MLSEFALMCYENGICEFGALPVGDENFEDLSPKVKAAVLDMLSTIRELQARVAELETALAGHRVLDQTHALTDAEGEITLLRHKLVVQHDALDTCHQALIENGDIVRGLTTEKQVLQARLAELEAMWQQEHTERIRLEEQVKYLSARLEGELEAAKKGET